MPIYAELSPVNNFNDTAICRQFKLGLNFIIFYNKIYINNLVIVIVEIYAIFCI